jgi:septum formation protein
MELILASSSPRRLTLLSEAGYVFRVIEPDEVESEGLRTGESAIKQARQLALDKADSVVSKGKFTAETLVLGADTVVALEDKVIGKARDRNHAREILSTLAGSTHQVITALAVLEEPSGKRLVEHDATCVTMTKMTAEQIEEYLKNGPWQGKAGAYAIQEDDKFIEQIEGSFSNVVGLPLELFERMLGSFVPEEVVQELK